MSSRPILEIDGSRFSTLEGFYDEVSRVLIPGQFWGHNLDAFNDILRGGFGTPEGGFVFCWKNWDVSRERLGHPETARQLEQSIRRCHPDNRDSVSGQLDRARRNEGPTVFDWLVEIIRIHGPGGAEQDSEVELLLA